MLDELNGDDNAHKKRAPLRVPVSNLFAGRRFHRRARFFQMRQVYRDMDRFIKIWIRLLVILRQIVQFFNGGLPSRFRRSLIRARRI
ncbi:hypothetical protein K28_22820, partial [Klebsiella pneumoniae]